MTPEADIAVIYVARGHEEGLVQLRSFVDSYRVHPAGIAHDLVWAVKGWDGGDRVAANRIFSDLGGRVLNLPDDGFDWGAYFRSAEQLTHRKLCLMNGHARPAADGWLNKLSRSLDRGGVGLVGATGSWESPHRSPSRGILRDFRTSLARFKYRERLRDFPHFPNPHLRSNAVMIERDVLLAFASKHAVPANKEDAHRLESATGGLSRFVMAMGSSIELVGADGKAYAVEQWPVSKTFRGVSQCNLLVTDNRTDQYEAADSAMKRWLAGLAWGEAAAVR